VLIIGSYDYLCNHIFPIFELFLLTLVSLLGIFLLLKANSLFVLYLSIEIQSIALYVLISARQSSVYTIEASLKYFIPSVFLTLVLLFGLSLIYSSLGTLSFVDLKLLLTESTDLGLIHVGLCLVCCGFLFKLAVFPFHG
jgi:NADH-quinone oxidoreductase subunit N